MDMSAIEQFTVGAAAIDREARFLNDVEAQVFQHRHDPRQRDRLADAIDLETQIGFAVIRLTINANRNLVGPAQRLQLHDIGEGFFGIIQLPIASLEGILVRPHPQPDGLGRVAANMGFQIVFPGSGKTGDLALEFSGIGLGVIKGIETNDVVHPGEGTVAELRVKGREAATEGFPDQLAGLFTDLRVVPVARNEKQGRHETVELVTPDEELRAGTVMQVENAETDLQQIILVSLEQLVAREILDRVAQLLRRVGAGRLARPLEDTANLAPDQRHGAGALVIGLSGEQADKARLADHGTVLPIPFDSDIIHVDAAMDTRLHIGLGHDDRAGFTKEGLDRRCQNGRLGALAQDMTVRITQNPPTGLWPDARMALRHRPVFIDLEIIDAAPQEGEVIVPEPTQEFHCLGQLVRRGMGGRGRQVGNRLIHLCPHVGPVLDSDANIIKRCRHALNEGPA